MAVKPLDMDRVTTYADTMRPLMQRATPADMASGLAWYADAREIAVTISERMNVSVETGAAIIAALSPRMPWARNVVLALDMADGREVRALGQSVRAAERAVAIYRDGGDPFDALGGPKTNAFARNIAGDMSAVTVDIWMMRAAGLSTDAPTIVQYREISAAIAMLAREYDMSPAAAQACLWTVVRGSAD
jgi:hypothetical protein